MKRLLASIAVSAGLMAMSSTGPAWACSCFDFDAETSLLGHDVIFLGRVMEAIQTDGAQTTTFDDKYFGTLITGKARVKVLRRIKGDLPDEVIIDRFHGGMCNTGAMVLGASRFFGVIFSDTSPEQSGYPTEMKVVDGCAQGSVKDNGKRGRFDFFVDRVAELDTRTDPEALLEKGRFLLKYRDLPGAQRALNAYLALKPNDINALADRTQLTYFRGDHEQAIKTWRALIARDASASNAKNRLSTALLELGRFKELERGHRDFKNLKLTGWSDRPIRFMFSGRDLTGSDFSGANLRALDFSGTLLGNANMRGMSCSECIFHGADLRGADLMNTRIHPPARSFAFVNADLRGANLVGARISDIENSNLSGADLTKAWIRRLVVKDGQLRGAVLKEARISEANFSNADLSGVNLTNAELGPYLQTGDKNRSPRKPNGRDQHMLIDFTGTDLSATRLDGAYLGYVFYDCATKWPEGFSPEAAGARLKDGPCQ